MSGKNKVCWSLTGRCNQNCKYCYGFLDVEELSIEDNIKILNKLIKSGVEEITWTGGEAVLYPHFRELLKISKEHGIFNKLVTNGIYLSQIDSNDEIFQNLDRISLSIDSINSNINIELGKGKNHFDVVKNVLDKTKNKDIQININTVITSKSINELEELGKFLNNYKIQRWKILKFMPVRKRGLENKKQLEVTEEQLEKAITGLTKFENIGNIHYRKQTEWEQKILVLSNGDIIKTDNGIDYKLGNALKLKDIDLDWRNAMKKIRTLIAYDNQQITDNVKNYIIPLDFVEVIGTAVGGIDTYNKIVSQKPEVVFVKYEMDGMSGKELIKKVKEKLEDETPTFNFIGDNMPMSDIPTVYNMIGKKMNAQVAVENKDGIIDILKQYQLANTIK